MARVLKVLLLVLQPFLKICIGIGIGNTFYTVHWYFYRQYFFMVLLTTLRDTDESR